MFNSSAHCSIETEDCSLPPFSEKVVETSILNKEDGALLLLQGGKIDKILVKPTITSVVSESVYLPLTNLNSFTFNLNRGQFVASSYNAWIVEAERL